jgi:hypothetical protein
MPASSSAGKQYEDQRCISCVALVEHACLTDVDESHTTGGIVARDSSKLRGDLSVRLHPFRVLELYTGPAALEVLLRIVLVRVRNPDSKPMQKGESSYKATTMVESRNGAATREGRIYVIRVGETAHQHAMLQGEYCIRLWVWRGRDTNTVEQRSSSKRMNGEQGREGWEGRDGKGTWRVHCMSAAYLSSMRCE